MGRKQSKPKHRPQNPPTSGAVADASQKGSVRDGAQRWIFRVVALVVVPVCLLLALELGLRMAGYGYSTSFFKPLRIGSKDLLVDNDEFGLRFFPRSLARIPAPVILNARKAPGTFRIFIFGESAALGDPRPNYGAGRYLEVLLRERFPDGKFEVINTAVTAINSHAVLPIARECARLEGDCWIIYMGNNEMVGPFGAATVFGRQAPPLGFVRLSLAVQETRLGQLLMALSRKLRSAGPEARAWHGMEMFLENKVPPDDPRRTTVCRNFEGNLRDMLKAGAGSGAKLLLNTVAVNLKDCPPFASVDTTNLGGPERARCEKLGADARTAAQRGNWLDAAGAYETAGRLLPLSADLHYHWAEALLHLTNAAEARRHFQAAVDLDTLPFRTDSSLNAMIRKSVALFPGISLVDAPTVLSAASTTALPGAESFYEHVHLNFDGNYRLGLAWAEKIQGLLPPAFKGQAASAWAPQEKCEELLGLTDWNRVSVVEEVIRRLQQPPLSAQSNNARRVEELESQASELRQRRAAMPPAQARKIYEEALRRSPEDHGLHENFAEFLDATGDKGQAILEWRKVCQLTPHYYFPYYSLATLLKEQEQFSEALAALEEAARLNPDSGEICLEQGVVYGRKTEWAQALRKFDRAAQLSPEDPRVPLYAGEVLHKLRRRAEAMDRYRQALRLQPNYWEAHYRLGEEFAAQGQISEAAREFEQTLQSNPNYVRARVNLAVALLKLGRGEEAGRQITEALRLEPQNKAALGLLQQMQAKGVKP